MISVSHFLSVLDLSACELLRGGISPHARNDEKRRRNSAWKQNERLKKSDERNAGLRFFYLAVANMM